MKLKTIYWTGVFDWSVFGVVVVGVAGDVSGDSFVNGFDSMGWFAIDCVFVVFLI